VTPSRTPRPRHLVATATATATTAALLVLGGTAAATAHPRPPVSQDPRPQLELLDRGWPPRPRAKASSSAGGSSAVKSRGTPTAGMTGADFPGLPRRRAHRDGHRQHQLPRRAGHADRALPGGSRRRRPRGGPERDDEPVGPTRSPSCRCAKPADGVTPAGGAYTYSASDMSVGDVDGDGQYE